MKHEVKKAHEWALILGASSGFGAATALELARCGYNIIGVHLDRQATMPQVQELIKQLKHLGAKTIFYNINAADAIKRNETLDDIQEQFEQEPQSTVKILMHSLAFGSLKPFIADKLEDAITQAQMEMTIDVMANSLVYWVQGLLTRKLMKRGGRIFGMTSSGGHTVIPYYGAVSAAKACLESHIRQLAMELGPLGITANAIMAGVTETPALKKIPGNESMLELARRKNPMGRLTTPQDVARVIALLSQDTAQWVNGNVIGVDGGEDIVGFFELKLHSQQVHK
ncbi:MAG: SDR family oxidoreductase [Bacteroidetes bacterium]|nr:SDR family oxidoreductase [Bacteroidota bacterium]